MARKRRKIMKEMDVKSETEVSDSLSTVVQTPKVILKENEPDVQSITDTSVENLVMEYEDKIFVMEKDYSEQIESLSSDICDACSLIAIQNTMINVFLNMADEFHGREIEFYKRIDEIKEELKDLEEENRELMYRNSELEFDNMRLKTLHMEENSSKNEIPGKKVLANPTPIAYTIGNKPQKPTQVQVHYISTNGYETWN